MATSDRGLQASTTMYGLAQWKPENLQKQYTLAVDVLVYSGIIGQGFRAYERGRLYSSRSILDFMLVTLHRWFAKKRNFCARTWTLSRQDENKRAGSWRESVLNRHFVRYPFQSVRLVHSGHLEHMLILGMLRTIQSSCFLQFSAILTSSSWCA